MCSGYEFPAAALLGVCSLTGVMCRSDDHTPCDIAQVSPSSGTVTSCCLHEPEVHLQKLGPSFSGSIAVLGPPVNVSKMQK